MVYHLDLHIHTPASRCFAEREIGNINERIVSQALESGLDMIAITDHHSVEYVDRLRLAASRTRLVVLPGVELSTRIGQVNDVYLLAIFEEHKPKAELDRLLINLGINEQDWGDCHFRVGRGLESVITEVNRQGGLLISNHLDKTPQRQALFPGIINQYCIKTFDLKNISFQNQLQQKFPQAAPLHCFTFSDAHRLNQIGQRHAEVDLSSCSFIALQQLLNA